MLHQRPEIPGGSHSALLGIEEILFGRQPKLIPGRRHELKEAASSFRRHGSGVTPAFGLSYLTKKLWVDVEALSDEPDGHTDDGLPVRQDRVGEIESEPEAVPILVERGSDGQWRIAAVTVARVPELSAEFGYGLLGDYIPVPLRQFRFLHLEGHCKLRT